MSKMVRWPIPAHRIRRVSYCGVMSGIVECLSSVILYVGATNVQKCHSCSSCPSCSSRFVQELQAKKVLVFMIAPVVTAIIVPGSFCSH